MTFRRLRPSTWALLILALVASVWITHSFDLAGSLALWIWVYLVSDTVLPQPRVQA